MLSTFFAMSSAFVVMLQLLLLCFRHCCCASVIVVVLRLFSSYCLLFSQVVGFCRCASAIAVFLQLLSSCCWLFLSCCCIFSSRCLIFSSCFRILSWTFIWAVSVTVWRGITKTHMDLVFCKWINQNGAKHGASGPEIQAFTSQLQAFSGNIFVCMFLLIYNNWIRNIIFQLSFLYISPHHQKYGRRTC